MSGRQSLAGAFAPVAPVRGAGLQGLLPPKRGRGTQAPEPKAQEPAAIEDSVEAPVEEPIQEPTAPTPGPTELGNPVLEALPAEPGEREESKPEPVTEPAPTPKSTPRRQPAAKKVKASETVPGALRNVGVYLPPPLLAEVKDAVYRSRTTYADLLIDAFEALTDEQIAREFTSEVTTTISGMPRRTPRKRGEAGIQIQLRLDGLQVDWLDGKVAEFDAPSRSALVSAVFKLHVYQAEDPDTGE